VSDSGVDEPAVIGDLWVSSPIEPWLNLGFSASSDSFLCLADLGLRFVNSSSETEQSSPVIVGWTLVDPGSHDHGREVDSRLSVDGIPTTVVTVPTCVNPPMTRLGITGVDHVVVMTGNLERTCDAITTLTRAPLKRIRDAGGGVRQGFHRCGRVIIEVVERPDIDSETPASIWGLVLTVENLDEVVSWLGPDVISVKRPAVQKGREIATFKRETGLGIAVALMSPEPAR
jgi:hypothetical protein